MSGRRYFRCSACGLIRWPEPRRPGEAVRVRPCPEHTDAEVIEHDGALQTVLFAFDQMRRQRGMSVDEVMAAHEGHGDTRLARSADIVLACMYFRRWARLPERGPIETERRPVMAGRGLFG